MPLCSSSLRNSRTHETQNIYLLDLSIIPSWKTSKSKVISSHQRTSEEARISCMRGDLLSWFRGDRRDSNGKNRLIKDKDFSINDELIGDNLDPQAITVTLHT
jgi:hypothetical protein